MTNDDKSYFGRRAREARQAQSNAALPAVKKIHGELAELYENQATGRPPVDEPPIV